MNSKNLFAGTFTVLALVSLDAFADTSIQMQEATGIGSDGKPAVIDGDPGYSFYFAVGDENYFIAGNGSVVQEKIDGSKNKFRLFLPPDLSISGPVYFANYQGDYLILYEISDEEDGSAELARIDGKTLAVKWTVGNMSFNVAPGLVVGKVAYVAGMGFIGAIDLDSGHYDWCAKDLYQGENIFVVFAAPKVENEYVISVEDKLSRTKGGEPYFLKIDWKIGKIITNAPLSKPIRFVPGCKQ